MVGHVLNGQPEIPQGYVIFISQLGGRQVDSVITFNVIGFGGKDRHNAVVDIIFDHRAHIFFIAIHRAAGPPDFQADDDE